MWGMPITNWEEWGKLVIKWAINPDTRPRDVADLNRQMAAAGAGGPFSTQQFLDLAFAQAPNETTLQIFLPTAGAIDRAMQTVQASGFRWTLPDFYSRDAFDSHAVNVKEADNVKFLLERIGEYAIGQCG